MQHLKRKGASGYVPYSCTCEGLLWPVKVVYNCTHTLDRLSRVVGTHKTEFEFKPNSYRQQIGVNGTVDFRTLATQVGLVSKASRNQINGLIRAHAAYSIDLQYLTIRVCLRKLKKVGLP